MVEIGVYSTVGTSWNVYDIMQNVVGKVRQRCGGSLRQRVWNEQKRRERCSEDGGVLRSAKFLRTAAGEFLV